LPLKILIDKVIYINKPRPLDSNAVQEAQTILCDTPGGIPEAKGLSFNLIGKETFIILLLLKQITLNLS
jgi:hypothetical protein